MAREVSPDFLHEVGRNSSKGVDPDFLKMLDGYGLAILEVVYFMPDHPSLLQLFLYQQFDVAPKFPVIHRFLDHWRREIEAPIQSVRLNHNHLIGPAQWRAVDSVITIN